MKYEFKVEQYHIDRAIEAKKKNVNCLLTVNCPIAQVLREQVHNEISVGSDDIQLWNKKIATPHQDCEKYLLCSSRAWHTLKPGVITIETLDN